ncbi:MAG: DUF1989 domain-containing protein [Proteobacteria bacterium]|nr:DUF1989 domain-containing protein [Pseudomonadota bacterium]NIS68793.1 DUF1989 domain-containing protein [Pseudomonadota bacterium]
MLDTLDLFMKYPHSCIKQHFEILDPVSRPGDYIEFLAEINCLVGLTNSHRSNPSRTGGEMGECRNNWNGFNGAAHGRENHECESSSHCIQPDTGKG